MLLLRLLLPYDQVPMFRVINLVYVLNDEYLFIYAF